MGASPVSPPIEGVDLDGVTSCWTLRDARRIGSSLKPGAKVVLMGAGFIGCIILEALATPCTIILETFGHHFGCLGYHFGGLGHHFSDFLVAGAAKWSQVLKMWSQGSHSGRKPTPKCLPSGCFGSHLVPKWCQKVAKGVPEEVL